MAKGQPNKVGELNVQLNHRHCETSQRRIIGLTKRYRHQAIGLTIAIVGGFVHLSFPSERCPVDSTQPRSDGKQWVGTG